MNINNTFSTGSSGNASLVAGTADRSSASAAVSEKRPTVAAAEISSQTAIPSDRATISEEAKNKLKAEAAVTENAEAPSEIKKFAYGVLGLDRPTAETAALPNDGFTYGRWAAAALTATAVLSVIV